jgi:hypothetical protein
MCVRDIQLMLRMWTRHTLNVLCCACQVVKSAARAAAAESGPGRGNGVHKSVAFAGGSDDDDM